MAGLRSSMMLACFLPCRRLGLFLPCADGWGGGGTLREQCSSSVL